MVVVAVVEFILHQHLLEQVDLVLVVLVDLVVVMVEMFLVLQEQDMVLEVVEDQIVLLVVLEQMEL